MEKRNENKLMEMYQQAMEIMKTIDCNKDLIEVGNIKLNGRLKRTLGRCYMSSGNIELSKEFYEYGKEEDVFETILHELSHRVCIGNDDGHGSNWQYVAQQLNKKLGTNITQYASENKIQYRASLDNGKYATFVCNNPECGKQHVVTISRLKLTPSDIESRYKCNCGGHITHVKH